MACEVEGVETSRPIDTKGPRRVPDVIWNLPGAHTTEGPRVGTLLATAPPSRASPSDAATTVTLAQLSLRGPGHACSTGDLRSNASQICALVPVASKRDLPSEVTSMVAL